MGRIFVRGLIFGFGFVCALVIAVIGLNFAAQNGYLGFRYIDFEPDVEIARETREPEFSSPKKAEVAPSAGQTIPLPKKQSLFRDKDGFEPSLSKGGGILAVVPMPTDDGSKRLRTYQLWLSDSEFWQIRTNDQGVEVEKLPYPETPTGDFLFQMVAANIGFVKGTSTISVSKSEIEMIRRKQKTRCDANLNGDMTITKNGIVFFMPNDVAADNHEKNKYRLEISEKRKPMIPPKGGGVFAIAPKPTSADAKRLHTYQLWLTETELWEIETDDEGASFEKLSYPDQATGERLSAHIKDKLRDVSEISTRTIGKKTVNRYKMGPNFAEDKSLNGRYIVEDRGIVYFFPNPSDR